MEHEEHAKLQWNSCRKLELVTGQREQDGQCKIGLCFVSTGHTDWTETSTGWSQSHQCRNVPEDAGTNTHIIFSYTVHAL